MNTSNTSLLPFGTRVSVDLQDSFPRPSVIATVTGIVINSGSEYDVMVAPEDRETVIEILEQDYPEARRDFERDWYMLRNCQPEQVTAL